MHTSCWIIFVVVAHWEFLLFSKPLEFFVFVLQQGNA
jgi:hypothetical protein